MKGKHHKHHATGGAASGDPPSGKKTFEEDLKDKPKRYNQAKVEDEAEEKKHGGRAKRKHGGRAHKHHEKMHELKHAHHVGKVHGSHKGGHKGHKARGGSNFNPLSSAHAGSPPKGHHTTD